MKALKRLLGPFKATTKARSTGTIVTVCTAEEAGAGTEAGELPWFTVCDTHGSCVGHESKRLARQWASAPEGWCDDCREMTKTKKGG